MKKTNLYLKESTKTTVGVDAHIDPHIGDSTPTTVGADATYRPFLEGMTLKKTRHHSNDINYNDSNNANYSRSDNRNNCRWR